MLIQDQAPLRNNDSRNCSPRLNYCQPPALCRLLQHYLPFPDVNLSADSLRIRVGSGSIVASMAARIYGMTQERWQLTGSGPANYERYQVPSVFEPLARMFLERIVMAKASTL